LEFWFLPCNSKSTPAVAVEVEDAVAVVGGEAVELVREAASRRLLLPRGPLLVRRLGPAPVVAVLARKSRKGALVVQKSRKAALPARKLRKEALVARKLPKVALLARRSPKAPPPRSVQREQVPARAAARRLAS
jgi:hypothetical protein